MKWDCLVVIVAQYRNWQMSPKGEVEVFDEETTPPKLVGVYRNVSDCVEGCLSVIAEYGPGDGVPDNVKGDGPVESVTVFAAEFGSPPGHGKRVGSLPLCGSRADFDALLRKELAS